jgi:small-conductance mechanosensitive channel
VKVHRFDLVSLLFGIVVIVVGIGAINGRLGNLINDRPDALLPLIALGAGLLAITVAARRSFQDVHSAGDDQHDRAE